LEADSKARRIAQEMIDLRGCPAVTRQASSIL
jgi:hypothetical protein